MSHEKKKRFHTQFNLGEPIEEEQYDEEELPKTSSRPSDFSFGDGLIVTKSRDDRQADKKLKKQELKDAEKKKELERAAVATRIEQEHAAYLKLRKRVELEAYNQYRYRVLNLSHLANYKDPTLTDEQRANFICPACGQYQFPPHDPQCLEKYLAKWKAWDDALLDDSPHAKPMKQQGKPDEGGYRKKSLKKIKSDKKRRSMTSQ
jgi:hypothetical protein